MLKPNEGATTIPWRCNSATGVGLVEIQVGEIPLNRSADYPVNG
ncbi:hypothetical protein EMIT013CA1_10517 [Bacillus sp. IT-13CA1]